MTIKVTDDGQGFLAAKTSVDGDTTFANTYKADPVSYGVTQDVKVSKTLTGRDMAEGQFTIKVTPGDEASAYALSAPNISTPN